MAPTGEIVDRMRTRGSKPTNVAFSHDSTDIYVTEVETSCVQRLIGRHRGLKLFYP